MGLYHHLFRPFKARMHGYSFPKTHIYSNFLLPTNYVIKGPLSKILLLRLFGEPKGFLKTLYTTIVGQYEVRICVDFGGGVTMHPCFKSSKKPMIEACLWLHE